MTKLFVATKGIVIREGKILVIRESAAYKDASHVAKYDVTGGRLNPGEHYDDALRREILEETGLSVDIGKTVLVDEVWPKVRGEQWQIVRIFFICTAQVGEVKLSEDHDDYKWIDPLEYKNEGLIENLYPVFEAYLKGM